MLLYSVRFLYSTGEFFSLWKSIRQMASKNFAWGIYRYADMHFAYRFYKSNKRKIAEGCRQRFPNHRVPHPNVNTEKPGSESAIATNESRKENHSWGWEKKGRNGCCSVKHAYGFTHHFSDQKHGIFCIMMVFIPISVFEIHFLTNETQYHSDGATAARN